MLCSKFNPVILGVVFVNGREKSELGEETTTWFTTLSADIWWQLGGTVEFADGVNYKKKPPTASV